MKQNKREFLKVSTAIIATLLTSKTIAQKTSLSFKRNEKILSNDNANGNERMQYYRIANILKKRFPNLKISDNHLQSLFLHFKNKPQDEVGVSGLSKNMVNDTSLPQVTYEDFVIREFVLNSNYTLHLLDKNQELAFIAYGSLPPLG